jgi:thiamine kinase-like enzyme
MKIIYVKCSTQRNDQYQIMTSIIRSDDGNMIVRKEPVGPAAHQHLDRINSNALQISQQQHVFKIPAYKYSDHIFETDYIQGNTFEQELVSLLEERRYEEFEARWIEYKKLLEKMPQRICNPSENEAFRSLFGETDRVFPCMDLGHVDLITENIIRSADGTLWNIDPEWIL